MSHNFQIIQGGMGVGVSSCTLARTVSKRGQLGVISGTGIATCLARRLQNGDPTGDLRRAIAAFPLPAVAQRMLNKYFVPNGIAPGAPYKLAPMPTINFSDGLNELTVLGAFVEVWLAKEGHSGVVGMNLLEKIQTPTLASLYGAMLADVDYILMGAGIPRFIPGALDNLAAGKPAEYRIDVEGAPSNEPYMSRFDPVAFAGDAPLPAVKRPKFLAIISSATLALTLARKSNGKVDGFIVEGPIAGGHNAPPRGQVQLNDRGEPIYGPRDVPDLQAIKDIGLPFYLAGGYATPDQLAAARATGASGVQIGTAFAFCNESGMDPDLKAQIITRALNDEARVFTDPKASPTGFPFKVLETPGTMSEQAVYEGRTRICDQGYLRRAYKKEDGTIGYRCAAEPIDDYLKKGGTTEEAAGRKCLCNGLLATIGLGQTNAAGVTEIPILTAGDEVALLKRYLKPGATTYSANDVLDYILAPVAANQTVSVT